MIPQDLRYGVRMLAKAPWFTTIRKRLKRVPCVTIGSAKAACSFRSRNSPARLRAGDQIHACFKCSAPRQTRRIEAPQQMLSVGGPRVA